MNSRDKILAKVKYALSNKLVNEEIIPINENVLQEKIYATVPSTKEELIDQFKSELIKVNAQFFKVNSLADVAQKIDSLFEEKNEVKIATTNQAHCLEVKNQIEKLSCKYQIMVANDYLIEERKEIVSETNISIVQADFAVSEIGSLVFCYDHSNTSYPHFLCDFVIAFVHVENLLPNQFKLIDTIDSEKSKNMVFVAGPSRTADIEKVLVLGAHGPRKLLVILIDSEEN